MDTYKEFQKRRKKLADLLGNSVTVISNSHESSRNRDCDYPFRSDSYFHYLSGFPEPESVIFIVGGDRPRSILFCKPKDISKEIWNGYIYGPEEAAKQFLFDEAYSLEEINKIAPKILKGYIPNENIYCIPPVIPSNSGIKTIANIQNWMGKKSVENEYCDLSKILDGMRCLKSEGEINIMQKSANIAAKAHTIAMQKTKPGLYEYQIEGEILNQFMQLGAKEPSYQSIVAGGINACTLHYSANNSKLIDGDLLLIDAGCELEFYASDITRTYPINGRFSSAQKTIYELVLASQKASILEVKPGNSFNKPHETALNILIQGMVDLGLCKGSVDEVLEKKLYRDFFMHRTSHWLGLDVHDVGNYVDNNENSVLLEKGNVLTIEPGCYIKPSETTPKEFWGIGIRIEDDVEVTNQGNKVLSIEAPKEINEIESLVGSFF